MNRTDRLTGILIALQGGSHSAGQLAQRFEVSRRTIMRDIDALGEIGVPIMALTGRSGGYSIAKGYWLPPLHLSADEATVMLFALKNIGDHRASPLGEAHRSLLDKLHAVLDPEVRSTAARNLSAMRVDRDHASPQSTVLTSVREAIARETWCTIDYRGPHGSTTRTILPTEVHIASGRWYVAAIDSLREAPRVFRMDRIAAITSSVRPPIAESLVAAVTSSAHAYDHPDHPEIHAELSDRGVLFALDHPDLRESVVRMRTGGEIRFRCPEGELPYYGREFLRLGREIEVLAPSELRQWMLSSVNDLLSHLRSVENRIR